MRILWVSNAPWAATGYGVQTKLFVPRLNAAGHQMAIQAFWGLEGGVIRIDQGIPVYPKGFHPYGQDMVGAQAAHFGADIVISLVDAWVMEPQFYGDRRWCPYFPIDMSPIPPPVLRKVEMAFQPICFSEFGMRESEAVGLDPLYVPHAVDCDILKPMDRTEARQKLGFPPDRFIVGMVAANKGMPSRKAFPEQLKAFSLFCRKHPDAMLYIHSYRGDGGNPLQGVNLPELADGLGIAKNVLWCDQFINHIGFEDGYMQAAFSSFDVLMNVSTGEGFGVPILEAQACGTPVITGDWTAMSEITFSGWKVAATECHDDYTGLAAYQFRPRPEAILACLEEAYAAAGKQKWRQQARNGALRYDADLVVKDYWLPALAKIEAKIERVNAAQKRMEEAVMAA